MYNLLFPTPPYPLPPFSPSLISLVVSVDIKHHGCLLTYLLRLSLFLVSPSFPEFASFPPTLRARRAQARFQQTERLFDAASVFAQQCFLIAVLAGSCRCTFDAWELGCLGRVRGGVGLGGVVVGVAPRFIGISPKVVSFLLSGSEIYTDVCEENACYSHAYIVL